MKLIGSTSVSFVVFAFGAPVLAQACARADIVEGLAEFEAEFKSRRETGGVPGDDEIAKRWAEWESRYA